MYLALTYFLFPFSMLLPQEVKDLIHAHYTAAKIHGLLHKPSKYELTFPKLLAKANPSPVLSLSAILVTITPK